MKKPAEILEEFQLKLKNIPDKKLRVKEITEFSVVYGDCFGWELIPLLEEGIETARANGDQSGEVLCFCNLAFMNRVNGLEAPAKYSISLEKLTEMVEALEHDSDAYALGLNMISYFHWFRGEFERAFNLAFASLKIAAQKRVVGVGWNHFGLAVFYFDTRDFVNSGIQYSKALETFTDLNYEYGIARASNGLGSVSIAQNRIGEALPLLDAAAVIYKKMGHYAGLSRAKNDIGLLEKATGNYTKALEQLQESLSLRKEINHLQGLATSYTELGEIYLLTKDHKLALEHLQKGLKLALEARSQQKQMRLHKLLYDAFKELGNTELALQHFEKYFEVKSQILSDEAANNIKRIQTNFEKEKSEKEAELERFKNGELKKANAIIEQKNKDITDSINYARRIQLSILPPKETLDKCFENYFVFYKPKDIVSGDFYWARQINDRQNDEMLSVIAAVDCTGHGVPGAFMSVLGNTLLNQTFTNAEIKKASDVLDYLNHKLPENLKANAGEHIRDGMDMSLCVFDFKNLSLQFAGANNPCWIVRDHELIELKGDKQAISAGTDLEKRNFTNQAFALHKNDMVYLFTDGFADQFGGPNEKKFSYKRLRELLLSISDKSMNEQKELLNSAFINWRAELEQVDDVCVIGVKV